MVLDDPVTVMLLRLALAGNPPQWLLCGCAPAQWRQKFDHFTASLCLSGFLLRPYSLRRGGATAFFCHTGSLSLTLERGRWAQSGTASIYLTEGRAVAQSFFTPWDLEQHLNFFAQLLHW